MKLVAFLKQTLALLGKATLSISAVLSLFLQLNKICDEMQDGLGVQDAEK